MFHTVILSVNKIAYPGRKRLQNWLLFFFFIVFFSATL
jgi:hypothetical protein